MTIKICLCGSYGVGKTSLRRRLMGVTRFRRNYLPTVGSDFSYKEIQVDNFNVKIMIWDLAGEERFRQVRSLYFQGAHGAILVFDLTNRESFNTLDEWITDLENYTSSRGVPLFLLGNKIDLVLSEKEQAMSDEEIHEYLTKLQNRYNDRFEIGFSKTSALSGENVYQSFETLVKAIINWLQNRAIIST